MSTPAEEEFLPVTPEEQQALRDILEILFKTRDVDFSHYRETTIMRRLFRRMGLGNFSRYADYLAFIKSSHSEAEKLYGDLLLSYTEFFRDPVVFETLKQTVFPALFESHNAKSPIRIWVPGCSTGEEVYSLAICFLEFLQSQQSSNNIQAQFFGTDLNPDNIDFARAAVYHDKARSSISQHRLDKYFDQTAQGLKVSKHVREMCVFAVQNITQDAPFSNMDMVSCRNVLIYFDASFQETVIPLFHFALREGAYLLLGSSETMARFPELFSLADPKINLYTKRKSSARTRLQLPARMSFDRLKNSGKNPPLTGNRKASDNDINNRIDQILLDSFTPPCVLVDSGLLIRHFRGQLFPFLQPSAGEATLKLSKMVSESLMPELYLAIEEARKSQQRVTKPSITVTINGSLVSMTITVIPMMCSVAEERCFLILFDKGTDNPIAVNAASAATNEPDSEVARLRQELITTKQHLQSMIEEKDEINQELWASNEEVQSANEELQSVNEEMEAAKEELESSNEELLTLNEELSNKTRELNSEKQALRESEFFFRESQKAASIGSYKADFIADRWESSEILDEIFGIDKDYSRTVQGWLDIVYPDDREMMARHLREEVAINRKPFNREYRIIRKSDGAVRWVYGLGKAEFDIVGNISSLIGTIQDITDLKRTEEALQNSQKLDSLGMLAGGIAHDFNNLLAGIFGNIDLAEEALRGTQAGHYLETALSTIERARGLTQQLITFAKGGAPCRKPARYFPMVKQVAQFALSGSNVSIIFNEAPHLWPGNFDEIQIGQVVENIVINAMQAMPLGGAITFSAENAVISDNDVRGLSKGNYVRIAITDRGVGIPPEILPRIFDPFFTTKEMGRGLGLSTSYSIVVRHGGTIDVSSVVGMGSTFTIYLPALIDRTEAPSLSSDGSRKHSGKGTVLVMDDEEVIRETVSVMLENFGYSVLLARNGQEAVALYKNETSGGRTIVAMILDITVPGGMGGIATVAEIRKLGAETPVFVSSGYSEDPAMMIPANFGFTASIRKPYTSSDLSELFNAWVKTSR